jgi:RNA polymerase sigma factor FliA
MSLSNPAYGDMATYLPLVDRVVKRFEHRLPANVLRDDLVSTATLGLLDALRRSPQRGPAFTYYAQVRIEGALIDGLRSQDWLHRSLRRDLKRARARGEQPTAEVVCLGDLPEQVVLGLTDPHRPSPEQQLEDVQQRAALGVAMARLPEREACILALHYFEGVALQDIASRLGVSGGRVSQLHRRAVALMRDAMNEPPKGMAA